MTHNERQQRQFGPRGRKDNQRKWRLRRIASRARRLRIEPLEDRLLLAVDVQYEQLLPEYTVHQQDELLALLDESWSVDPVASRISPELRDIYQAVLANPDTPVSNDLIVFDEVGNVGVRITAEDVEALQTALGEVSFVTTGSYPQLHFVEGFLPANSLLELEQLSSQGLLGVLPMYRPATAVGKVDDQADYILESRRVRAAVPQGYDGTGITIGIISDSYDASQNARTRAAADIASGDLPADGVNVVREGLAGATDEGRAMAQLIHDVAPGTSLAFASALYGEAAFAQSIRDLADPAKGAANIIVDDVVYYTEPFFQDGIIAQAVDDVVTNRGVSYFSSAGNQATNAYESTVIQTLPAANGAWYDFDQSSKTIVNQRLVITNFQYIKLSLQWDDPFYTTSGVDTNVDMYLYRIDPVKGTIDPTPVAKADVDNIATQTPVELLFYQNQTANTGTNLFTLRIKVNGQVPGRIKWVNYGSTLSHVDYATNSPTVSQHAGATNAEAVAAAPYFNQLRAETFTSNGPTTILFTPVGQRLATAQVRQTPKITSIDGTDTTFFGSDIDGNKFPNFSGTSAAAPHAAAVAALVLQANPNFTPAQIYGRLETTATDIGAPGCDNVTGHGLINAYDAVFGPATTAALPVNITTANGLLSSVWETHSGMAGRIWGVGAAGTLMVMDSLVGTTTPALNEAILHVAATGADGIKLSFQQAEYTDSDEPMSAAFTGSENSDGVAFSVDGSHWYRLISLTGSDSIGGWKKQVFDLSTIAAGLGLTLGSDVRIKFQQYGKYPLGWAGFLFQDIRVAANPVLTFLSGTRTYSDSTPPILIDPVATLNDPLNACFDPWTLTVSVAAGVDAKDRIAIRNEGTAAGQISVSGNSVRYGTLEIGTFSGGVGANPLVVDLNQYAYGLGVLALVRNLTFSNFSSNPSTSPRTLRVTLQETAGSGLAEASKTINVININQAPLLDNSGATQLKAIPEDPVTNPGELVSAFLASGAGGHPITDGDEGTQPGIAVIGVDNTNGTWEFSTNSGTSWTAFGAPSIASARLLAADANTRVRFQPGLHYFGIVANGMTFRAWDQTSGVNGGTADTSSNGGQTAFSTASETASIAVYWVNVAPTLDADTGIEVERGGTVSLTTSDLRVMDMESPPTQITYTLTGPPTSGTLRLDGTPLALNVGFTQADIDNGRVSYEHLSSEAGLYDGFSFTAVDGDGASLATPGALHITVFGALRRVADINTGSAQALPAWFVPAAGGVPASPAAGSSSALPKMFADPSTAQQADSNFGSSIAVDADFTVVGVPMASVDGWQRVGRAYVFSTTTGALIAILDNPTPADEDYFGYSVAISGSTVVIGAYRDDTGATDVGAAYAFDAATGNLLRTLNNPTPAVSDYFGYSVAVSGSTIVVGAYQDDAGATDAGAAYVFDAATGNLLRTLNNPTPAASDIFGYSVAVSGSTVGVGARQDDTGATDAGAAYIFDVATGNLLRTLNNPTPAAADQFGVSVAVSGNTVVVGAPNDDTGATDAGAAYVFNAATGSLLRILNNPTPAATDKFGSCVAVSGSTVVVGAPNDDTGATDAGTAYVFDAATGNLLSIMTNPTPAAADKFGSSVAVSGSTVLVTAPFEDTSVANAGAAYVFNAATGNLLTVLNNPTPAAYDNFGYSVAVSGRTIVVGAYRDDTGAYDAGAAYVFDAATGNLLHTLNNPTPAAYDNFGYSVAVSGSIVVVGALEDDTGASNTGAAYIFDADTGDLLRTLNNPTPAMAEWFGCSVAVSGSTVVVGAQGEKTVALAAGAAYVFDATTGDLLRTLNNPTPAASDFFGASVAVSGSTVVVGAHLESTGYAQDGAAYVFDANTGDLLRTLNNPTPAASDAFGSRVAVSGSTVVVAATGDDTGGYNAGAAYVFDAATGDLVSTLDNPAQAPAGDGGFGLSVAVSGSTVAVGATYGASDPYKAGAAYVFDAATGDLLHTPNNPAPFDYDRFGASVAVSGSTVVVGAFGVHGGTFNRGAVYVFYFGSAPTDITLSGGVLPQYQPLGTLVGTLSTSDPDLPGESHRYTLVAGAGDSDNGLFQLEGNLLKTRATLESGVKSAYSIRVRTMDDGGLWYEESFAITVTPAATDLLAVGDALYFAAGDVAHGVELWKTDGSKTGIAQAAEIRLGNGPSDPHALAVYGGVLYFAADDGSAGTELWKFDGTMASLVADINPGSDASAPADLTVFDGALYFRANDGVNGEELWRYDGTSATMVADISAGVGWSSPSEMTVYDGCLYFAADDGTVGRELWAYDGSDISRVADIHPSGNSSPGSFVDLQGHLYFAADDGVSGRQFWRLDGLQRVTSLNPGVGWFTGGYHGVYNNAIYVSAFDETNGQELWMFDGTTASLVADINTGTGSSSPAWFAVFNDELYFAADDGVYGQEVWRFDGTTATRVADIHPNAPGSEPSRLTVFDGDLYFVADDGRSGAELWRLTADANPVVGGAITGQTVNDNGQLSPFITLSITDSRTPTSTLSITVTLDHADQGAFTPESLTASGVVEGTPGTYTFTGDAVAAQVALRSLVFAPTSNRLPVGQAETTRFTIQVDNGLDWPVYENTSSVVSTSVADTPTGIALSVKTVTETAVAGTLVGNLATSDPDTADTHSYVLVDNAGGRFALSGAQLVVGSGAPLDENIFTLTVRSTDAAGLGVNQDFVIAVTNVAPTAGVSGPTAGVPGQPLSFTVMAADAPWDGAAGFTYYIEWGDSSTTMVDPTAENGAGITTSHTYAATGNFTVRVSAGDLDSDIGAPALHAIAITQVLESGGNLLVGGTADDDNVQITPGSAQVYLNGEFLGSYNPTGTIQVFGHDGDDTIQVDAAVRFSTELYGQEGNDMLTGGSGATLLDGGDGNDLLTDGGGVNTLVASAGSDEYVPGTGSGTFEIDPSNTVPLVLAESYQVPEGQVFHVSAPGVLANDVDPLGFGLFAILHQSAQHGGLTLQADGSFSYTPFTAFVGSDSFQYRASNGLESAPVTVSLTVIAIGPPMRLGGTIGDQPVDDKSQLQPFATVTVTDVQSPPTSATVIVTQDDPSKGTFTADSLIASGFVMAAEGSYRYEGASAEMAQAAIRQLEFAPAENRVPAGEEETTSFMIEASGPVGLPFLNNAVTVDAISINDAPTAVALAADVIPENTPLGTVIGVFTTTDPDFGGAHTYVLASGEGDLNNSQFIVDGNQLKTNALLDYETRATYSVRVRSTDQGGLSTERPLVITVTDVDEIPPTVTGTTPSFATSGTLAAGTTSLEITFSEAVAGADVATHYQLQSFGPDGLLGTADGVMLPLMVTYTGSTATLTFAALPESAYGLTVHETITDVANNVLDGDGDGTAGGDWVRNFVVVLELPSLVVTTASDPVDAFDGLTSLREAISYANTHPGNDTITFDPSLAGQTITLANGELALTDTTGKTTIVGLGANQLTLDANQLSRVLLIDRNVSVDLAGLAMVNGRADFGGAIRQYNGAVLTIADCSFSGNAASNYGGALMSEGPLTVLSSYFAENAAGYGGAMYTGAGQHVIIGTTFFGNSGVGSGIINYGTTTVIDSTFSGNLSAYGGGIYTYYLGTLNLKNTLIAGNVTDVLGNVVSQGNNLIGNADGSSGWVASDLLDVDPLLGALGNYGGSTKTMPLLPGSPAIDAGDNNGTPATDQRGFSLVGTADIGAFESQGFTVTIASGDNQSTSILSAFTHPLVVTVVSAYDEPIAGGKVTFTAPASGASAIVVGSPATIAADGQASVTATANYTAGQNYTVMASGAGIASPANFTLSNDNNVQGLAVSSTAVNVLEGGVAQFTVNLKAQPLSDVLVSVAKQLGGDVDLNASPASLMFTSTNWYQAQTVTISAAEDTDAVHGTAVFVVSSTGLMSENVTATEQDNDVQGLVTTIADTVDAFDGLTSLREAISYANTHPGNDTITFDPSLAGQTITLANGELALTDTTGKTTIIGLGADQLTLDANQLSRVLLIDRSVMVDLSGLSIVNGRSDYGGAIRQYYAAVLNIADCSFSGNSASGYGGALMSEGQLMVLSSYFADNSAGYGGGIYTGAGQHVIIGTTFYGNSGVGSGIINYGVTTVIDSTFSGNLSAYGGGIYNHYSGTLNLKNTLIAGNVTDVSGNVVSQGYNLIGNAGGSSGWVASDLLDVNPLLGPLGNYGGPTKTMPLLPGSPAIDAGDNNGTPATDQRGFSLVGTADIGAFESQGFTVTIASGDNQSTSILSAFTHSLVVTVVSAYDEPVAGGKVTFTAPASGASAIVVGSPATIAADGQASATATAGANAGSYTVTTGGAGIVSPANFTLSNTEAASLEVTTATDVIDPLDGVTSLREAITYANSHSGHDTIEFSIGSGGLQTIQPSSPLPALTDPVTIDGTTQPGYAAAGHPIIEIDGTNAVGVSPYAVGLWITATAGGSTVRGLVINRFNNSGIVIQASDDNVVAGNYIGTNAAGDAALGNGPPGSWSAGVQIIAGAKSNRIGGDAAERNVISGDGGMGVWIHDVGTDGNVVAGNFIGTDADGDSILGNLYGVAITDGAAHNRIGTDGDGRADEAERNLISGNRQGGVLLNSNYNTVAGNYIGTDVNGSKAIPNGSDGVQIGGSFNSIGGDAAERNVISGNTREGVLILGDSYAVAGYNAVAGNYIGTNAAGDKALGNGDNGIQVMNADTQHNTQYNTIERNLISGNSSNGVGISTNSNIVTGNYIGTDVTGTMAIPNLIHGMHISGSFNRVGTDGGEDYQSERNVISGNKADGVVIVGLRAVSNIIAGNYIGTDMTGTEAIPNGTFSWNGGISIEQGATLNVIGTDGNGIGDAAEGNVISGNVGSMGVWISDVGTEGNVVAGNFIGTDADGDSIQGLGNGIHGVAIANGAADNRIGTKGSATERNVIAGSYYSGVVISGVGSDRNVVAGNYIGTDVTGARLLGNGQSGVWPAAGIAILGGAKSNRIGTDGDGVVNQWERNIVSGNMGRGVLINGMGSELNVVAGNYIGTDITGTLALANGALDWAGAGVEISGGASANTVGTQDNPGAGERNLISGNAGFGVFIGWGTETRGNLVVGNYIGTDADGDTALGNGYSGVLVGYGAESNVIERNLVSGNSSAGVQLSSDSNIVAGNYIGTDVNGSKAIPNGSYGVLIGGSFNRIGTDGNDIGDTAERNVISGNIGAGVVIAASSEASTPEKPIPGLKANGNLVAGNYIGTDATGLLPLGNGKLGDWLSAGVALFEHNLNSEDEVTANQIGGSAALANTIAFNAGPGVAFWGDASGNAIRSNSIYSNVGLGIDLGFNGVTLNDSGDADTGPNNLQNFPVITVAEALAEGTRVAGTLDSLPGTTFTLDLYASSTADPSGYGEGERCLGSITVTTNSSGHADFDVNLTTAVTSGNVITATATENGNTSEFSSAKRVNTRPTANAGGPYTTREGDALVLDAVASSDPDGLLGDSVVKYEWDLDQGGDYEVATTQNTFIVPWAALVTAGFADGPAQTPIGLRVGLRVSDMEGATDTQTVQWDIENAAPAADITGPTNGVPGQIRTFTLGATDPSPADQAAGFTYNIDWDNDDSMDQTVSGVTGQVVSHVFTSTGTFEVHVTATDKDGGTSEVVTFSVPITAAASQGDDLAVGGTTGSDTIVISPSTGTVEIFLAGVTQGVFPVAGQVLVFGSDGYDVLRINGTAAADVIFKTPGYVGWGTPSPDAVTLEDFESTPVQQSVTYTGIERTLVSGGGGDDWIFDPSDVDTEIYGDAGNDTIVVDGANGNVVADGGDGSDAVIVSCGSLFGAIDIGDSGTALGETNSLTIKGASGDNAFTVANDTVTWGSTETVSTETIFYSPTITSLSVETGSGTDTNNSVQIESTSAAGVTITAQGGTDTYEIQLGSLAGPVSVDNDSMGSISVTIVGTDDADALTLSGTGAQTATGETITLDKPVAALTVNGGAGDDQITINNLESPVGELALDGGDGSDTFTIVDLGESAIETLTVEGGTGTGNDQVVVEGELPPGVELQHVAPLISTLEGPSSGVRGQTLAYTGSFVDPDNEDSWTATVDYGDGTGPQTLTLNTDKSFQLSCVYSHSGNYTITVTVDDDSGTSSRSIPVAVHAVDVQRDTNDSTKAILAIGGTTGDDIILIAPGSLPGHYLVSINGLIPGNFTAPAGTSFDRFVAFGQAGNDDIMVAGSIDVSAWLYGGIGNDRLKGGGGNNVLLGGEGDDLVTGGQGRDLMIGGLGADRLVGNADDDILISGATAYDANDAALGAILNEWTSTRSYAQRTANLLGTGTGSDFTNRLNGDYFLQPDVTVYDDNAKDTMTGCAGRDWFFANVALDGDDEATCKDKITDLSASEFALDLDFINAEL